MTTPPRAWRTLSSRTLLARPPWIQVSEQEVELPDGRRVAPFYRVDLPEFAVVVATTADGEVLAERQYKHGVGQVSLFLPAGLLEPGEDPLAGARRELREETGFEAEDWEPLGAFVVDGNRGCGRAHVFAARGARRASDPDLNALEPLEVLTMAPEAFLAAIRAGEVAALAHVAAFLLAWRTGAVDRGGR